ncbi:hypothetical protein PIROE2DRAFT_62778 [Piromyces sp. E2]|nr:hypothetical protein PIROE2DRAFT_62778 [Piromyces sp. E2]|eukprot:OUM61007.1 hypothetical protein PIROE2DRAFT_62778 [Piromyces sp. E2]
MPVCPGRVYEIFRQSIEDAWQVWEMMILGEPILVLGDTPRSCSETVYTFMELIKPVPYGGDFRPYFTIQDSDFKNIVKKELTLPNVIIGTTNPVFNKALSHWTNTVYVQRKPCNTSMINNDKIAQQPVGVGKPIQRESQSIVSSLWTSLMPSNNMSTSSSLKNIATLFPSIGSTNSINNDAFSSSSNSNIDVDVTNLSSASSSQTIKNLSTPTPKATATPTVNSQGTAPATGKNNGFSGFHWSSILNGSNSSAGTTTVNPIKHTSSHDITALGQEDTKNNKSSQASSKYGSFFSSLTMKKNNDGVGAGSSLNKDNTISANSSTSTLHEVAKLTPSASNSNLNNGDNKPSMPSPVLPTLPGKTNIECIERIVTKHKSFFHKDKNVIKKITEAALMGYSLDIINNMFRRHFVELSEKFLQPLDYYFDKEVIYNVRLMKFSDLRFSPQIENFNIEAFLKIINETAPVFPLKCKRTLIEFYRLFMKSPNFSLWFLLRVCNAFREWRRRYFYVMCDGDIRYWIKTGSTRFYGNKTAKANSTPVTSTSSAAAASSKASTTTTTTTTKGKKPEEVNITGKIPNSNSEHNLRVKSPESIRTRGINGHSSNTFDTSSPDRLKSKEINVKSPKLIEIIELLMRYRDEIYHYEGLFVDKDVDLTSFSSRNLEDKKGKGIAGNTNSMSRTSSGGFYQMRRSFSGSADSTQNVSKTSLNTVGSQEDSNPSVKEKETASANASTTTTQDTQHTTGTPTASRAKPVSLKNKKQQITKSGTLAEEATLNDLNDQEITKMYDREELIKRIFNNPEIEKFKKRRSRHRHIVLPIPLSCPTPKSTRFYENLTSMDDLILPTKEQYLKMKKQYKLLLNTFSEDLRAAIEAQLKD